MTELFNTSVINRNDPLWENKINALKAIKDYLQGVTSQYNKDISLDILEKHLWSIINEYGLSCQREDSELREVYFNNSNFENDWHEKIKNANDNKEINKIKNVVTKAILKWGPLLTQELKRMRNKTFTEAWARTDFENGKDRGYYTEFYSPESSSILREKLAKFDAKTSPNFIDQGDWEKNLARDILRDVLIAKIKEAEEYEKAKKEVGEEGARDAHNQSFNRVLNALREAKFSQTRWGGWKIVVPLEDYEESHNIGSFRGWVKQNIESDNLKEKWLPEGQKKTDLLRKLEELIQAETTENANKNTNNNSSDDKSQNISKSDDNSSQQPASSKSEKSEWEKLVEETKNKAVEKITEALASAGLSQHDLNEENQNWSEQIDLAVEEGNATRIQDIESKLLADISNKKETKKNSADLDNLLQKFQNQAQPANDNEFTNALKTVSESLGEQKNETKTQAVKKAMLEQDSELYFETFVKWVKEEMKVCEMKNNELETEERKLINGEITDPNEFTKIEKKLEEKVATKKHSWSFSQKLSEWQNWLKTKAAKLAVDHLEAETRKIKQQIYSLKSSTNFFKQQAYKNNEAKVNNLLTDLNTISQKKRTNTSSPSATWPKALGIGVLITVPLTLVVGGIIFHQRKIKVRQKSRK